MAQKKEHNAYKLWADELGGVEIDRDCDGVEKIMDGFWRIHAAKTKPDTPVAIWTDEGHEHTIFQIGRKRPMNTLDNDKEWYEFLAGSWLHCKAVDKLEYDVALTSGFWNDGKPSRKMDNAEKMGIDTNQGDNAAPVDESLKDQIEATADRAKNIPEPTTQEEADKASEVVDKLRQLWKLAEAERIKEKAPFDEGAKAVQAKWLPIMNPAKDEGAALDARRKSFLRKEQARLDKEVEEARKKAEAEAAAEQARLHDDARKAAQEAGEDPNEVDVPEVQAAPVEAKRATSGSAYGRSSGLRKTKVGVITDKVKFITAISDDDDFMEYLDKRAQAAARAGIALPGMKIEEVLK